MDLPQNPLTPEADQGLDLQRTIRLLLTHWVWFALGLVLALSAAYLYLRYAIPVYKVSSTILLETEKNNGLTEEALVSELGFKSGAEIEDEMEILRSSMLMKRVVDSLNLQYSYLQEGRVKTSEAFGGLPFSFTHLDSIPLQNGELIRFRLKDTNHVELISENGNEILQPFGSAFLVNGHYFRLDAKGTIPNDDVYTIAYTHPAQVARDYAGRLKVNQVGRSGAVSLTLEDPVPYKAEAIQAELINAYNLSDLEVKVASGEQTLTFIEDRLKYITVELNDVEQDVESFRRTNRLPTDIVERAADFLAEVKETDKALAEIDLKLELLGQMEQRIRSGLDEGITLPVGYPSLLNVNLDEQVKEYNTLILQRQRSSGSATEKNPSLAIVDRQLDQLRTSLAGGFKGLKTDLTYQRNQLAEKLKPLDRQVDRFPRFEREYLQIIRQQQVKEQLFLFLLQKREETALSIAAQRVNSRILNPPVNSGPVSPNRRTTWILALFLGLGLPFGLIYLYDRLDNRIHSKEDLEKLTRTPFMAAIGENTSGQHMVVNAGSRSSISEMFRLLRTNLRFAATDEPVQVILVTSSVSGEGKTFVTLNLGLSEALAGKKVLLLGMDMRKPKLHLYAKGTQAAIGLTNYLVGEATLDDLIHPLDPDRPGLDIIGCGPVPPNPAELILSHRTKELFKEVRNQYDVILVDTAPFGLVTDAFLLAEHVDQTLLVARQNITIRDHVSMIEEIYSHGRLPKLGLVLNGVKRTSRYGYSYGYGYGYGYYDDEKKSE